MVINDLHLCDTAIHEQFRSRNVAAVARCEKCLPSPFRGMGRGRGNGADPILGEGYFVGVHVVLDRHRRPVADDLDEVVGSGEDPVLVVDGDIAEVLDEVR